MSVWNQRSVSLGVFTSLAFLFTTNLALAQTVKVPDSTPVSLSLMDALSSETSEVDEPIHFEVTDDVKVGNVVAIPKGSTATGHVVEVEARKRMGRAGKLNFTVDYVKAPSGDNVRLRSSSTRKGKDETGTVIVGTVLLSPLFLIRRGHNIEIPKGTRINAYVDGDRDVSLGGAPAEPAPPQPAALTAPVPAGQLQAVAIKSAPDGADITVDGRYVGSTPSTVTLSPGDHLIKIEKSGFKAWERTITVSPGSAVTVSATLEQP